MESEHGMNGASGGHAIKLPEGTKPYSAYLNDMVVPRYEHGLKAGWQLLPQLLDNLESCPLSTQCHRHPAPAVFWAPGMLMCTHFSNKHKIEFQSQNKGFLPLLLLVSPSH